MSEPTTRSNELPTCRGCRHWRELAGKYNGDTLGECRAQPPLRDHDPLESRGWWVRTMENDWCGYFQRTERIAMERDTPDPQSVAAKPLPSFADVLGILAEPASAPTDSRERGDAMLKFRKLPVVVEAFQMTKERRSDNSEWPSWLHRAWCGDPGEGSVWPDPTDPIHERLVIGTLEGRHLVEWGDWIIRGIKGELYACKPGIFVLTYEPVTVTMTDSEKLVERVSAYLNHFRSSTISEPENLDALLDDLRAHLAPPVVRSDLGTIHSPNKCGVIEGWMLKIARAVGLDITQGVTGSQVLDPIKTMRAEREEG